MSRHSDDQREEESERCVLNRVPNYRGRISTMIEKTWVYILASDRGVLYIGVTSNLYKRVLDHRSGINSGFATKYKCHRLIYYEEYAYITSAIAREKELKGWRRSKKLALIQQKNERFRDLAEDWGKPLQGFQPNNNL